MSNNPKTQKQSENYIHDYEGEMTKGIIAGRTADSFGAFFLPYLRPGMSLLDCGCGPGTITVGLAQVVAPGKVIGIDIEDSQLALGRENATEFGLNNVKFEQVSAYELSYTDEQFDAVFSHAMLEHLQGPVAILKELHRVLKPGGVVGIRSPDLGATLIAPADEVLNQAYDNWVRFRFHSGGNPFIGRHLRALLREAGFTKTIGSASNQSFGTEQATRSVLPVLLDEFTGPRITKTTLQEGWADQAQMDKMVTATRNWAEHPDAFISFTWCEGVAWKAE